MAFILLEELAKCSLVYHRTKWLVILSGVGFLFVIALSLRWMLKQQKMWATVRFSTRRRVIISVIGIFIMFMSNIIQFGPESKNDMAMTATLKGSKLGLIYVSSLIVIGPIIEELIFRFMIVGPNPIGNHVKSKITYGLRIIISALLFGAWHLHPTIQSISSIHGIVTLSLVSINYIIAGIILACLYAYTQDIRVSIIAHCGSNLIDIVGYLIVSGLI